MLVDKNANVLNILNQAKTVGNTLHHWKEDFQTAKYSKYFSFKIVPDMFDVVEATLFSKQQNRQISYPYWQSSGFCIIGQLGFNFIWIVTLKLLYK